MKKLSLLVLLCCSLGMWAQKIENDVCYFENPNNSYKNFSEYLPASAKDHTLHIANPKHTILKGKNFHIADLRKDNNVLGLVIAHESSIVVDVLKGNNPEELKQIERDYIEPLREYIKEGCAKNIKRGGMLSVGDIFWLFPNCKLEDVLIISEPRTTTFMGVNDAEVTDYTVDYAKSDAALCAFKGNVMQIRIRIYRYYDPKADKSVFVAFNQVGIDREYELTKRQMEEAAVIGFFLKEAMKTCQNDVESLFEWLEKSTWKNLEPDFQKYFHLKGGSVNTPIDRCKECEKNGCKDCENCGDCEGCKEICNPPGEDKCEKCVKEGCKDCEKCGDCEECKEICRKVTPPEGKKKDTISPPPPDTVVIYSKIPIKMLLIPGGEFMMGCQQGECESNEKPAHKVRVDSFYMAEIEVTQQLYESVMGRNPSIFKQGKNYPVDNVSWNDCQEFLKRLNMETNLHFDLPTEAQWEYAARGGQIGSPTLIYAGDNEIESVAWYKNPQAAEVLTSTMPVASKRPNALGVYDMSGNVMEWCKDKMGAYPAEDQINPQGPTEGSNCVLRGGSWDSPAKNCRITYRYGSNPMYRMKTFGLRLVLRLEEGRKLPKVRE